MLDTGDNTAKDEDMGWRCLYLSQEDCPGNMSSQQMDVGAKLSQV